MTPLDCGQAVQASGTCPRCGLTERPLWEPIEDLIACASCITRLYPGRDVSFLSGDRATTARQMALL